MFLFVCLKEVQAKFRGEQFLKSHVFEIRSLKRPGKANLILRGLSINHFEIENAI